MKAVTIPKTGGPQVLEIREYPDPVPKPGEVVIKVAAAGVNFADILARRGLYPDGPKLPAVVGYEVSGLIAETGGGSESAQFSSGDRVVALTRFNGYADTVAVPADQVFPLPDNLSLPEAAAIPVNYLTAWQLAEMGGLQEGDTLLIHNAGGGVGLAALDIARKRGARTIGTASAGKHERLKARGLDVAIDYRTENWVERVMEHTDGRGVDLIFDPLGGSNWKKSFQALSATGRLGLFGVSEVTESGLMGPLKFLSVMRKMPFYTPVQLMNQNKGVYGVNVGRLWNEKAKLKKWAEAILDGAGQGWIAPHVDAAFTFEQAAEAHRYIEERKNFGKVVLTPISSGPSNS
ncbi:medium chain dehydrogenase/reductase family protein [Balneolales bacterium ANBcel1]|nr:medium chain dehydrogenase/reductase family protein [Balneolales bacterium ANBcel1]